MSNVPARPLARQGPPPVVQPLAQLEAVKEALALDRVPIDDRLSWLRALLVDVTRSGWVDRQEDADPAAECVAECWLLLDGLARVFVPHQPDDLARQECGTCHGQGGPPTLHGDYDLCPECGN